MGLLDRFKQWWLRRGIDEGPGSIQDLRRRLNRNDLRILVVSPQRGVYFVKGPDDVLVLYRWHRVPKRGGGTRLLFSPTPELKVLQRLLLRKVFKRLSVHPSAMGFVRGQSIVTHAKIHVGQAVVVRIDIKEFFTDTNGDRLRDYFLHIGWSKRAAQFLLDACSKYDRRKHRGGLPQGAPTSPILSNLVNYRMDARLAGLAKKSNAIYSRYADDIIFSFAVDDRRFIRGVIRRVRKILWENGYRMHGKVKLRIMRRHQRQIVTGLVVNDKVQLPRKTRRWLRAIEHHVRTNRPITLTPVQLQGWRALQQMVRKQSQ
jgi:retron-type reverse transcriptase